MESKGKLERTIQSSIADIVVDPRKKPQKIEEANKKGEYKCSCCGKVYNYQRNNFPISYSLLYAGNNGYLTMCRACVDSYFRQLVDFYSGNEEHAIEHCCRVFDWYYSNDAVAMTKHVSRGTSPILMYPAKMSLPQIKRMGTCYLDTVKEKNQEKVMNEKDIPLPQEDSDDNDDPPAVAIEFFGFGYKGDEYKFLWQQYQDWTSRYECQTKAQEELFKNICITQLAIQRAQLNGNVKGATDAMRTFQDLLGTANLKPSQNNDSVFADQNTFGTLIKKWEAEQPIAAKDPEWEDVDGINKMIDTFFLGHLCNLVHVKNDKAEDYKKEMEKYTVKPPVYQEDDDVGESSLLDKFSDKDDNKHGGST